MSRRFADTWNSACFMLVLAVPLFVLVTAYHNVPLLVLLSVLWTIPSGELLLPSAKDPTESYYHPKCKCIVNRGIMYLQFFIFSIMAVVIWQYKILTSQFDLIRIGLFVFFSLYIILNLWMLLKIVIKKKN